MIIEIKHSVDPSRVLEGHCSEAVYDVICGLEPMVFEIEVEIDQHDEIVDVQPGPAGCTLAIYLGFLKQIAPLLRAGEYQEILQALRDHEDRWHRDELPELAMEELRGRMEAWSEEAV